MLSDTQKIINKINTQIYAYPDAQRGYHDAPHMVDGWDLRYKWHDFRMMVTSARGYDYWMWPMSSVWELMKIELVHHSANIFMLNIIVHCEGKLKVRDKNELGQIGQYIEFLTHNNVTEAYIHDNMVWRADHLNRVYEWYAKTAGWGRCG